MATLRTGQDPCTPLRGPCVQHELHGRRGAQMRKPCTSSMIPAAEGIRAPASLSPFADVISHKTTGLALVSEAEEHVLSVAPDEDRQ